MRVDRNLGFRAICGLLHGVSTRNPIRPSLSDRRRVPVALLFFLSGFCGLLYEVLALRWLRLVLGGAIPAVSMVLAIFMGAMALGAVLGGRLADRTPGPLRWYGWGQIGLAIWFLLLPLLLQGLSPLYFSLCRSAGWSGGAPALRFVIALLLLLPPCMVMGATLPLVVRTVWREQAAFEGHVARYYALNAVGGGLGAWSVAFLLLPRVGAWGAIVIGSLLSLAIGCAALRGSSRGSGRAAGPAPPGSTRGPASGHAVRWALPLLYAIAGALAMTFEICWTRCLSVQLGGTVYAFALMLACVVLGLGLGSGLVQRWAARSRCPGLVAAGLQTGVAILAGASLGGIGWAAARLPGWLAHTDRVFWRLQALQHAVALSLFLPAALLMGALFPFINALYARHCGRSATGLGRVAAANTLGCVAGSLLTGLVVVPALGVGVTMRIAVVLAAWVAGGYALLCAWGSSGRRAVLAVLLVGGGMVLGVASMGDPSALLQTGVFARWVRRGVGPLPQGRLLYQSDGVASAVSVQEMADGERVIFLDGKPDASSVADLPNEMMVSHVPLLLHPDPRRALVVGLASGVSAGSALTHGLERLDCAEIEPAMVAACRLLEEANGEVLDNPRLRLLVDDGRHALGVASEGYDVIISEPSNPWLAGMCDLFTREFFALCASRLNPGGLMCAWLETYTLGEQEVRDILATFNAVFPYVTVWNPQPSDYFLIGSTTAYRVDPEALRRRLLQEQVAADLARIDLLTLPDLLSDFVAAGPDQQALCTRGRVLTDANGRLEFSAPRSALKEAGTFAATRLLESARGGVSDWLAVEQLPEAEQALIRAQREARRIAMSALALGHAGQYQQSVDRMVKARALNSRDRFVTRFAQRLHAEASQAVQRGAIEWAATRYRGLLQLDPAHAEGHYGLGFCEERQGRMLNAYNAYQRATLLDWDRWEYHVALAGLLQKLKRGDDAILHYRVALDLQPDSVRLMSNLGLLLANASEGTRDLQEAEALLTRACGLRSWQDRELAKTLVEIYVKAGKHEEALALATQLEARQGEGERDGR